MGPVFGRNQTIQAGVCFSGEFLLYTMGCIPIKPPFGRNMFVFFSTALSKSKQLDDGSEGYRLNRAFFGHTLWHFGGESLLAVF